jgi:hypothetical protein
MCIQQFIDWFNNDFLYLFEEKQANNKNNIIMVESPIIVIDKHVDKQLDRHNLDEWDIL